jgi:hypothetical protein
MTIAHSDEVTHTLTSMSYLERRDTLLSSPNNFPRYFYKYLGPRIEEEKLRDLFIESRFHLQSPSNFNDPFDMKGTVVDEPDLRIKEDKLNEILKKGVPHLQRSERKAIARKKARDPQTFPALKQSLVEVIDKHHLLFHSRSLQHSDVESLRTKTCGHGFAI